MKCFIHNRTEKSPKFQTDNLKSRYNNLNKLTLEVLW